MRIKDSIEKSIQVKQLILANKEMHVTINNIVEDMVRAFVSKRKVLFCGNGGSAADAQHLAAEFSGRYGFDRPPLFAEALHVNSSYITAVANDYSFEEVYSRMVEAIGQKGDILVGISTSGNSLNVVKALKKANDIGMITVGFIGANGGKMAGLCKYIIDVPSNETPRIQESHILIGHIICDLVERELFGKE